MRKYLVAAILIAAFATPALVAEFYVGYDGKRCEMFSHTPGDMMNLIGTFKSKHDAEKAMKEMSSAIRGEPAGTPGLKGIIASSQHAAKLPLSFDPLCPRPPRRTWET
jgi:hypothetical protein